MKGMGRKDKGYERKAAKKAKSVPYPASGAFFGEDYPLGDWEVQCKHTDKKSFRLDGDEIASRVERAHRNRRRFAMQLRMSSGEFWLIPDREMTVTEDGICL